MALARRHRLLKKDIDNVFKRGKTVKGSFFFIKFLKNDTGKLRLAVSISKKVLKTAVARNKIKRFFSNFFYSSLFLNTPVDLVIVVTTSIVEKPLKEIKREMEQAINKIFV